MSKWVNTEKFEQFKDERSNDVSDKKKDTPFARKYPNPVMGTNSTPKEYHLRLIPDMSGNFYKRIHYHMFQSGETWHFITCPKSLDFDNYCPWCQLTQILYQGSDSDKKRAQAYKRKDKFVGNVYVVKDPRDADQQDKEKHLAGKTFLYEFPGTIEQLIKKEITDIENGWGYKIFDPEDGHNLIISIGAKKPDQKGKVWPDYSLTTFAKKASAIAEDIDSVMQTTQDVMEYITNSMKTPDEHAAILKSELVYDDVKDQFERMMLNVKSVPKADAEPAPKADAPKTQAKKEDAPKKEEPKKDEASSGKSDDDEINDLLSQFD